VEYLISLILIAFSALFSGLTLGYFSLNVNTLERRAKLGNKEAQAIYPIRRRGNQLLTTLLLGNVMVNTALSIYLGSIASGLVAGLIATSSIFVFGEIVPQAVLSRHGMWFGSRLAPVMKLIMLVLSPIAYPIAYFLDRLLGQEMPTLYSKRELMQIVSELEDSDESEIDADEERIVHGALQFSHTTVRDIMTPRERVVSFDENRRLDDAFMEELRDHAYSRYPIYSGNPDNIVGILYTRDLITEDDDIAINECEDAYDTDLFVVRPDNKLDAVLALMLKRRQHLAIVKTRAGQFIGVVSLEDIIEEIIQVEIEDEDERDELVNNV
jgi:metal transporter CNNM